MYGRLLSTLHRSKDQWKRNSVSIKRWLWLIEMLTPIKFILCPMISIEYITRLSSNLYSIYQMYIEIYHEYSKLPTKCNSLTICRLNIQKWNNWISWNAVNKYFYPSYLGDFIRSFWFSAWELHQALFAQL